MTLDHEINHAGTSEMADDAQEHVVIEGTDDLTKAYRQFATSQPQYSTVAVWNPKLRRVEFLYLRACLSERLQLSTNSTVSRNSL